MANVKKLSEDEVKKNLIHAKVNNIANLELLEQTLVNSDDENRILFVETNDRQYEVSSVEVHQQVNITNDIETVILIKVI